MAEVDEELASNLRDARKKPRHFAIIESGSTVLKVIVSKKKISSAVLTQAKKEVSGKSVTQGVVKPSEEGISFLVTEAPSTTGSKLKQFLQENAGMNLQLKIEVVATLDEIADAEAEQPEAAPAAPATPTVDLAAEWKKALATLTPAIQAAIQAKGPDAAMVTKLLTEAVALGKTGGDTAKALATLKQCHALATRPASTEDPAAAFNQRLAALMPAIKAALTTPIGADLKSNFAAAGALAQKKDFAAASELLDTIEASLQQDDAPQEPDADELRERLQDVQIQAASLPDAVKALLQTRTRQALAQIAGGDLGKLASEVEALEAALAKAAGAARVAQAQKQSGDAVSYRLLQSQWRDAQVRARAQLQQFVTAFLADPEVKADPDFAAIKSQLGAANDLLPEFGTSIETALEAIDLAKDDQGRSAARAAASQVMDEYAANLESAAGLRELQSLSNDEYGGISFYTELQQAVESLKNQLSAT